MRKNIYISLLLLLPSLILRGQTFGLSDALIAKTSTGGYALNLNGRVVGMSLNAPFVQMNIGTNNSQNFGLYQNNVQRILMSSTGTAFTGGLTWNSSILDNASTNALVLGGTGALGYRPLSSVAFTGSYASLTGTPTNNLSTTTANGNNTPYSIVMDGYGDHGLYGTYDPTKISTVFGMGTSYTLPLNGTYTTNAGNFYGIARSFEPNYGAIGNNAQAKIGLGHQFLVMENGITTSAIGSGIWTSGLITANGLLSSGNYMTTGGSFISNQPINSGGQAWQVNSINRFINRYGGDESTINGSKLEWYSYSNTGGYNDLVLSLSRGGDLTTKKLFLNTIPYANEKMRIVGDFHLDNGYSFLSQDNGGFIRNMIKFSNGNLQIGAGNANGLTNKVRFYDAGGILESEIDNSYGIGVNQSSGRYSISAGQTGFIDFFTNNALRMRIDNGGNVSNIASIYTQNSFVNGTIKAGTDNTKGAISLLTGTTGGSGYIEFYRPNQQRAAYIGSATNSGAINYISENGSYHYFSGGKVEIASSIEVPNPTTGIQALNWNTADSRYSRFGNWGQLYSHAAFQDANTVSVIGSTHIQSTVNTPSFLGSNGTVYQQLFALGSEYDATVSTINGYAMQTTIGRNTTTPYQGVRFKEAGVWGAWMKMWAGNSDNLNNQAASYYLNVANHTGILPDARLTANVPLKNSANDFQATNRFYGTTLLDGPIFLSTPNQSPVIAAHKVMMQDASNQPNRVTQGELSTAFANLTQQAYQAVLIENGSYSIPNDAGYVVMSRSGTLTNTGIYTINLPTTPNSNTQEIEFSLPFLHATIGFQLQFKQAATLVRTISFGTSAQTGNNYAIYAPSYASFKIRYNSLANQWYIVNIYNPN
jgi:hypothetical protein